MKIFVLAKNVQRDYDSYDFWTEEQIESYHLSLDGAHIAMSTKIKEAFTDFNSHRSENMFINDQEWNNLGLTILTNKKIFFRGNSDQESELPVYYIREQEVLP